MALLSLQAQQDQLQQHHPNSISVIFLTNKVAIYINAAASTSLGSDVASGLKE